MELGKGLRRQLLDEIVKNTLDRLTHTERLGLDRRIREYPIPGFRKGRPPLGIVIRTVVQNERERELLRIVGPSFVRECLPECEGLQNLAIDGGESLDDATKLAAAKLPEKDPGILRLALAVRAITGKHEFRVLVDDARSSLPVEHATEPLAETTTEAVPSPIAPGSPPLATLEQLSTDLEAIQSQLPIEAARLERFAAGMADGNLILDDAVPTRLGGLLAACRAALKLAADLRIPLPASDGDVSVKQLARIVGEAIKVRQNNQFAALFSTIARLEAHSDESRALLRDVQAQSKLLTGDMTEGEDRRAGLVHASQSLIRFVENEFATNAEWDAAFHAVESVFGRSVAIAASRNQYSWRQTASTEADAGDHQELVALTAELDTRVENSQPDVAPDESPTEVGIVASGAQPIADISVQVVIVELPNNVVRTTPQVDAGTPTANDLPPLRQGESARRSEPRTSFRPAVVQGARELAQQCLADPRPDLARDLVWALLTENLGVFAAQLARTLASVFDDSTKAVLDALLLSPLISSDHSEAIPLMAAALGAAVNIEFESDDPQSQVALAALAFCASACPSLVAPSTSASAVLRAIRPPAGLESLFELCRSLADASDEIHGLDSATLASLRDHSSREAALLVLSERATEWLAKAPAHTINFAPATHVWQAWCKDGGLLHNLVLPVLRNDAGRVDQVKRDIAKLRDQSTLEQEVNRTFLELKRGGRRIHGDALAQFRRHAIETLDLVDDWTRAVASRPEVHDYQRRQAEGVRRLTLENLPRVQQDVDRLAKSHPTPATACARVLFAEASRQMLALFKTGRPQSARAPNEVLTEDLLRIDEISLDEYWEILDYDPTRVREALLHAIANGPASWIESLEARNQRFDHRSTARIIARADVSPDLRAEQLQERAMRVQECQAAVLRRLSELSGAVEEAVAFGLLRGDERLNLDGTLEKLRASIVDDADFGQLLKLCEEVKTRLATLRDEAVSEVRARVSKYGSIDEDARGRIVALLNRGDILTANEYLVMVQAGQPLPGAGTHRDPLVDFFVTRDKEGKSKAQQLDEYLQNIHINQTIEKVAQRKSAGPLDFRSFSEEQAEAASVMLEAWFSIKRAGPSDASVMALLEQLGLRPISVTRKSDQSFDVVTDGLSDRSICPVPQLGSLAKGRYRLVLLRSRPLPSDEDILRTYGVSPTAVPPIVFYFGKLSESRRRALALLSRERRQALVIVDDTLALYLASVSDGRLATLLDCTLPFTLQMPFTTTAGLVPVEMFYGRRVECEELMSTSGSSFIFGGRQLGKTALLRHVEREFHRPSEGQVAQWMDLKTIGLGFDLPLEELWPRLALELKKWNVLSKGFLEHANHEKVLEGIATWLAVNPGRRVLFLLDEADQFLETDAKNNFRICDQLKSLMDRTERRFKVVFAGLHNVQRTTRSVNHPLAHFGRAICVGPLLDSEAREARALIERPLGVLGYRFESPDLVTRILSQTNYYPSLIQLYCLHLLRHVCDHTKAQFAPSTSPPYVITGDHIDKAYRSRDLRQAISDRFKLTLQLDSRYEVLAYAFAHAVVVEKRPEVLDGATPDWFRENAVPWWSEGFAVGGTDNESLRCLLDEMVGLGVFRLASANQYALRSPNVAVLLGTEHEIRDGLYNENRTLPVEYAPDTFRRKLAADDPHRSPFTALQESDLRARTNGVSVTFGCGAAGLDQVGTFLRASFGPEYTLDWSDVGDPQALQQRLDALVENRPGDGVTLALIPNTVPWTFSWVLEAKRRVERLKSTKSFVRILFISDPAKTWQLAEDGAWRQRSDDVATLTLRPWRPAALQQWLIDCGFPHDAAAQDDALSTTGGWSALLLEYYEHLSPKPSEYGVAAKRLVEANRTPERARAMAELFGLGAVGPEARLALALLAQVGPASEGDLVSLDSRCDRHWAAVALSWASALGLATPLDHRPTTSSGGDLQWRLDGAVAQIFADLPGA